MLEHELKSRINNIEQFRRIKEKNSNVAKQKRIDNTFHELSSKSDQIIHLLDLCHKELGFKIDDEIMRSYELFLKDIIEKIKNSNLEEEIITNMNLKISEIETSSKNLWPSYYRKLSYNLLSTLEIIKHTNPQIIDSLIKGIEKASTFPLDRRIIIRFASDLKEAKELYTGLSLDDDVITFLKKVNGGKATILDLNGKIIDWIKNENLEGKIKLTF